MLSNFYLYFKIVSQMCFITALYMIIFSYFVTFLFKNWLMFPTASPRKRFIKKYSYVCAAICG